MIIAYAQKIEGSEASAPYAKGSISVSNNQIHFKDWKISFSQIEYINHKKEFILWGFKHTLSVKVGETIYMFHFKGNDDFLEEIDMDIDRELNKNLFINLVFWVPIVLGLTIAVVGAI